MQDFSVSGFTALGEWVIVELLEDENAPLVATKSAGRETLGKKALVVSAGDLLKNVEPGDLVFLHLISAITLRIPGKERTRVLHAVQNYNIIGKENSDASVSEPC